MLFQYKAKLQKGQKVIAEGHTVEAIEKQIVHFKRQQKYNKHTNMNNKIEIYHYFRDEGKGKHKKKLVKVV